MSAMIILLTPASTTNIIDNMVTGTNPDSFSPGIMLCLDGNPNKYFIGPGDLATRNEMIHVHIVVKIIVAGKEPRYGTHKVPDTSTISTC